MTAPSNRAKPPLIPAPAGNPVTARSNRAKPPLILAPAGNRDAFLAALAAGTDAIYCGLKHHSARMQSKNFNLAELAALTELAHTHGVQVYVTLNTMLKTGDLNAVAETISDLDRWVHPDALIFQDLAIIELARRTGFEGQLHLSTLANSGFAATLGLLRAKLGIDRVVLPRELDIDEVKALAKECPPGLELEVFIHGALCYGVSGRCYWSSYLGGKSGLRGRCVQPCRRRYTQSQDAGRFFSCQDLSLDVLVKVLASIEAVGTWKIEGRKKGPHYVYYTVRAYRLLRDQGRDPAMKKTALELLQRSLGRSGTHYHFLPQRPQHPVPADGQTGSGLMLGRVKGSGRKGHIRPREALLPGDKLRVGHEDDGFHRLLSINRSVPARGRFQLPPGAGRPAPAGSPVYLVDRREAALVKMLADLKEQMAPIEPSAFDRPKVQLRLPAGVRKQAECVEMTVHRSAARLSTREASGWWMQADGGLNKRLRPANRIWWWLPPVIWPREEHSWQRQVDRVIKAGGCNFVLNAPWQIAFFKPDRRLRLWAGPFCNLSNPLALKALAGLGFGGAIVSPELGRRDYMTLAQHTPMPLGIVISGHWPLCVTRLQTRSGAKAAPFTSPRGEESWEQSHGENNWIFPNWPLDLNSRRGMLVKAGYGMLVHLSEPVPANVKLKKRPGLWNWDLDLA